MSDDYGTVSVRGAERAREIEVLRQHYRRHRDALERMIADAPTEVLAGEYRRIAQGIERSIAKLDELEGRSPDETLQVSPPATAATIGLEPPYGDPRRAAASEPAMRPLHPSPQSAAPHEYATLDEPGGGWRVLTILAAALVALVLIGWLIWRASGRSDAPPAAVEPEVQTGSPVVETIAPEPPPELIAVTPPQHDYGVVRKGTRATRQFVIENRSEEPVTVQLARSACRCLYYDYDELIPPKGTISATVTIDGSKAAIGVLRESIAVASRTNPEVRATLEVVAAVQ